MAVNLRLDMSVDWSKCIICQRNTVEKLKCPLNGPGGAEQARKAYDSFLENVLQFQEIECLPVAIGYLKNTSEMLVEKRGSWHKSCRLKFGSERLERARKRVRLDDKDEDSPVSRRSKRHAHNIETSIFCGEHGGRDLHEFSTLGTDSNVRLMDMHTASRHSATGKNFWW